MFGLSGAERIAEILARAGFAEIEVTALAEPVDLGPDAESAASFIGGTGFARSVLEGVDAGERQARLDALRELLAARETPDGVLLGSAALLTSARRD